MTGTATRPVRRRSVAGLLAAGALLAAPTSTWRGPGAPAGDGQPDTLVVNATPGDDEVAVRPARGAVAVRGLAARVVVANPEPAADSLTLNTFGGNDTFRIGDGVRGLIRTTVNA